MEITSGNRAAVTNSDEQKKSKRRTYSIFQLPSNLFDSFRSIELLSPSDSQSSTATEITSDERHAAEDKDICYTEKWTCNPCKCSFDSLHDQRSHFKSDFHRFNIKLSVARKDTIEADDFNEQSSSSLVGDHDVISSISGSEDEDNREFCGSSDSTRGVLDDDTPFVTVREVIEKLLNVISEPRNNTCLRIMLLASGGHFAGCVFDGNTVVAHKTFHRYVVRAKAGKSQSSKDASGKIAHSAGASIRRHNELALFKDIRELLGSWKAYFDISTGIFIHAPSHNRKLLFDGENPCFVCQKNVIRHIPLTVRRPTLMEARRLYKLLTQISTEPDEIISPFAKEDSTTLGKENPNHNLEIKNLSEVNPVKNVQSVRHMSLPLHEAAKAGNEEKVLELLEQGSDPCITDERGRTAYMLAAGKEVRNIFRRFMALNPDKWDWQAAKVSSPLTKEMEESQHAKQANKDAKRKARAKKLKLLHKAKEKKAKEGNSCSHSRFPSRVAGAFVLVIGSLMVIAFCHMVKGKRTTKNAR